MNPNNNKEYFPKKNRNWRFNKTKMDQLIAENKIYFPSNAAPSLKRYLNQVREGITPLSILSYNEVGHTDLAAKELESIFNNKGVFDFPKPVKLIKWLLNRISNKNALILDFFAGSGTTGHAVMQLNRETGGGVNLYYAQTPKII